MKGKEIHNRFDDWAHRYLKNDLDAAVRQATEAHLADCRVCRERLAGLESIRALMEADDVPLPTSEEWADFHRRLRVEVDRGGWRSVFPPWLGRRWIAVGLTAVASIFIALIMSHDTKLPSATVSPEMIAREEILHSYPVESAGIPITFGEAALDSVLAGWLIADIDGRALTALIDGVEDPAINRYGADLVFTDLTDEELLLSLKEVL